jgi:hypothetical protein
MKNTMLSCIFLMSGLFCTAQQNSNDKTYDFSKIDLKKISINKIKPEQQDAKDSILKNPISDSTLFVPKMEIQLQLSSGPL